MKSKFKISLLIFALLLAGIYLTPGFRSVALGFSERGIYIFVDAARAANDFWRKYFATTQEIQRLREENERLEKYQSLYLALKTDYTELLAASSSQLSGLEISSDLVRILGYERLGEKTRFYASAPRYEHPRGLIANGRAVGILTLKENRPFAIALQDSASAIAAAAGKEQGIVRGDGKRCWMDFLEDFSQVALGAQVITSGRDEIFPAGVIIGRIESLEQKSGYKRALLSDCEKLLPYRYLHAISAGE